MLELCVVVGVPYQFLEYPRTCETIAMPSLVTVNKNLNDIHNFNWIMVNFFCHFFMISDCINIKIFFFFFTMFKM